MNRLALLSRRAFGLGFLGILLTLKLNASVSEPSFDNDQAGKLSTEAETIIKLGDWATATSKLRRALRVAEPLTEESFRAKYLLGFVQIEEKKWADAVEILQEPYLNSTYKVLSSFCLGLAYYHLNQLEQSELFLHGALSSDQRDVVISATYYLGMIQAGKKRLDEAKSSFEKVVGDPGSKQPILGYARRMLSLLLKPRPGDDRNERVDFFLGMNGYRLVPDLRLPEDDRKWGASLKLSLPVIDTDAVGFAGSLKPDLGRGGVGGVLELESWVKLFQKEKAELGIRYRFSSSYLLSQLDTSRGKVFNLMSHSIGAPYSITTGGYFSTFDHIQITPLITILQEDLSGMKGIVPGTRFTSYAIRSDFSRAVTALSNTEYELAARYDVSEFPSVTEQSLATGPALELGWIQTRYKSYSKVSDVFYGVHGDFRWSQGKNFRQFTPEGFVAFSTPTGWNQLDVVGKMTLGATYFYMSDVFRFDKSFRFDFITKLPVAEKTVLQTSFAITNQYSNQEIGTFNRVLVGASLSYQF